VNKNNLGIIYCLEEQRCADKLQKGTILQQSVDLVGQRVGHYRIALCMNFAQTSLRNWKRW